MCAMLCGGVRPSEHLRGLPKPLWIVVLCRPQSLDSYCTLEMAYFTRPSDGLQRQRGMRLLRWSADAVENTIIPIGYTEKTGVFSGNWSNRALLLCL